jgi:hypothetical protein
MRVAGVRVRHPRCRLGLAGGRKAAARTRLSGGIVSVFISASSLQGRLPSCISWPKRRAGWVCVWWHEPWALHQLRGNSGVDGGCADGMCSCQAAAAVLVFCVAASGECGFVQSADLRQCGLWIRGEGVARVWAAHTTNHTRRAHRAGLRCSGYRKRQEVAGTTMNRGGGGRGSAEVSAQEIKLLLMYMCHPTTCVCTGAKNAR